MKDCNPKLDALIVASGRVLIDADSEYLKSLDVSDVVIPHKLDRRIKRKAKMYERERAWKELPLVLRKTVAAVLIMCTVSFGLCLSVESIRAEIWNTFLKMYDKFASVFYEERDDYPTEITEYREPSIYPDGTEKRVVNKTTANQYVEYIKEGVVVASFQQIVIKNGILKIDNEDCFIENIKVGEFDGILFSFVEGYIMLTWSDSEYSYVITLDYYTDRNEILVMAESVN